MLRRSRPRPARVKSGDEVGLDDFAERVLRQRGREDDLARDLVRGDALLGPEAHGVGGELGLAAGLGDVLGADHAYVRLADGGTELVDRLWNRPGLPGLPVDAFRTATGTSSTNFLRPVTGGHVEAAARPLNLGRTVIVLDTELRDAEDRLVARVTQTQAVLR